MKAKEIRIGNYLIVDGNQSLIDGQIMLSILQLQYSIEPIDLTKEWIDNFGFLDYSTHFNYIELSIKNKNPNKHLVIRIGLQKSYFTIFNHSECDFTEMQYLTELKYVHQLQNIYYALTGVELQLSSNGI